jgi:RNA polymerase sigma-70 factor (ECF subfamily)
MMNMAAVTITAYKHVASEGGSVAVDTEERAQALERMYSAHAAQIYRFAYGKVGNREDAEDITSQVFLKAAAWLDPAQPDTQRLAWLHQVARTTVNDYWRRFYCETHISLDALAFDSGFDMPEEPLLLGPADADPGSEEAVAQVASLLSWLPPKYAAVLRLRFLNGLSLQETAEVLQTSVGNARVLQYRALRKAGMIKSALCP